MNIVLQMPHWLEFGKLLMQIYLNKTKQNHLHCLGHTPLFFISHIYILEMGNFIES